MRSDAGAAWAREELPAQRGGGALDGRLGARVALGTDLRIEDRLRLRATSVQEELERTTEPEHSFGLAQASLYVRIDAVPERVALYVDESISEEGGAAREAYTLVRGPGGSWLRAGQLLVPFGLRVADPDAFVRTAGPVGDADGEVGLEAGLELEPVLLVATATSRNPAAGDPPGAYRLAGTAELGGAGWRIGSSVATSDRQDVDFPFRSVGMATYGGLGWGPVVALAEVDALRGDGHAGPFTRIATYTEATVAPVRGLRVGATWQALDPAVQIEENERDRTTLLARVYPLPNLALRASYELNRDIPQRVEQGADVVRLQVHGLL